MGRFLNRASAWSALGFKGEGVILEDRTEDRTETGGKHGGPGGSCEKG